jgi:lactate racemase
MNIQFKYGNETVSCHLPDSIRMQILKPPDTAPASLLQEALIASLNNPFDANPLFSLLKPGQKLTIVVPDKTRECLLDRILPVLYDYMVQYGASAKHITVLFANGTHGSQSDRDMRELLGSYIWNTLRAEQHNAEDTDSLRYITTTSRGTPVYVNRLLLESDLVITVGGIVHHYFAGFGGGPKLLVPGVAGYDTAQHNHSYTIDETGAFHPGCRDGNLDTNPVYLDIVEAVRHIPNVFSINVVINSLNEPSGFFSGDIITAHREGASLASSIYEVTIREQADMVIVSPGGKPRDGTFIQSHKALHHASYAVKPGGSVLMAAACPDGVGSSTFMEWFSVPFRSLGGKLLSSYSLNGHTALSLRTKINRYDISLLSELDESTVSHMGMVPSSSLQSAVDRILRNTNGTTLVYIIPYGSFTVPVLQD